MKLDKIKFAKVVAYIGGAIARGNFDSTDVDVLDDMIDIPESEPQVVPGKADAQQVDRLLELMAQGQQKIEAIKTHRAITGMGLKDSKDAVEKYWPRQTNKDMLNDMLDLIDKTMTGQTSMLSGIECSDLSVIKNFINTYVPKCS